jgi:hypothetical protein
MAKVIGTLGDCDAAIVKITEQYSTAASYWVALATIAKIYPCPPTTPESGLIFKRKNRNANHWKNHM